jgi:hypothetical protein
MCWLINLLVLLLVSRDRPALSIAQLIKYHLKTQTETSLRNIVFEIEDKTMDNVQDCHSYINLFGLYYYETCTGMLH